MVANLGMRWAFNVEKTYGKSFVDRKIAESAMTLKRSAVACCFGYIFKRSLEQGSGGRRISQCLSDLRQCVFNQGVLPVMTLQKKYFSENKL